MKNNKLVQVINYLVVMVVTIFIGSWAITFLIEKNQETTTCTKSTPNLCAETECKEIGYFWWNNSCNLIEEQKSEPSKFSDYNYYLSLEKNLALINTPTPSYVKTADVITAEEKEIRSFIRQNGKIAAGYLFVDVSINNQPNDPSDVSRPLTVWDSIYVSLQRKINGYKWKPIINGHLFRPKSLDVPESNTTRLLYDLRQVPFTTIPYSDKNEYKSEDWLYMLNNNYDANNKDHNVIFEFTTFLSSLKRDGQINIINIGYECDEKTPNCNLDIIN